jgi:branched-chain amino acid aminotransferase
MEIKVERTMAPKEKPVDESKLGFGQIFTDHMFLMNYDAGKGWHDARITPYKPVEFELAAMVFHYGQAYFEGLKAYRTKDDSILLFRPADNFKRANVSGRRLFMPEINVPDVVEALKKLIDIDRDWVPHTPGTSLYIRPTMIATDSALGVRASNSYLFFIILSPVGAYYATGLKPVKMSVEEDYVRAVKGGTGYTKFSGNYAASLIAMEKAHQRGCAQVLWLDGVHRKYIDEVGSMNIFFKIAGKVVTPALGGSILAGITRDSIIKLSQEMGLTVEERLIELQEVIDAGRNGTLEEIFGTGTAAVVSPVCELVLGDGSIVVNNGEMGPLTSKLYDTLTGIQYGELPDNHSWVVKI